MARITRDADGNVVSIEKTEPAGTQNYVEQDQQAEDPEPEKEPEAEDI